MYVVMYVGMYVRTYEEKVSKQRYGLKSWSLGSGTVQYVIGVQLVFWSSWHS
jgi:hypothetical protein